VELVDSVKLSPVTLPKPMAQKSGLPLIGSVPEERHPV
jgi:hypothetical protein